MYISDSLAAELEALPLIERYDICQRAAQQADDPDVRRRLLLLALVPKSERSELSSYEHLMSCRDKHCPRCAVAA